MLSKEEKERGDKYRWDTRKYNKQMSDGFRKGLAQAIFLVLEHRDNHPGIDHNTVTVVYRTTPQNINSNGGYVNHQMVGCPMDLDQAVAVVHALFTDAPMFPFSQCDEEVRRYIIRNISPLEWQVELAAGDPELMAKYQVFCYETPAMPFREQDW